MRSARLAVVAAFALAGCNFAPPYERPQLDAGTQYKEAVHSVDAGEGWQIAEPRDADLRGKWWEAYGDPMLDELEERVAVSSETVIAAEANYRAAHALMLQAQAALYPSLSLNPSVTRTRSSASVQSFGGLTSGATTGTTTTGTSGTPSSGTTATATGTTGSTTSLAPRTIFSLPLDLSYQIDLWGSIRNNVAQNRFAAQASAAQVANALLSTQSTLAQDYFQLRLADEERRILDDTLHDFEANLHLVQTLFNNGLDSDEDLAQAQTQLKSAQAQATDLSVARATNEHAIAVLIGLPPAAFTLPYRRFEQTLPSIPVRGVPADLLERRPDIAAAERQVAAANAAIGVARAAYFPTLSLTGSGGYESTRLSQLLMGPNRFWSIGPALAQTLFDGGLRRAVTAQAIAQDDAAAATYRQTVLAALQGVEDNLATLRILAEEAQQEHEAVVAAQRAVELSVIRFRDGVDSYVNVITAQNAFLSARETEVQLELRRFTASVNLINNLGGGWGADQIEAEQRMATHPPRAAALPQDLSGPSAPNPPALPPREIDPNEMLKQDRDAMATPASPVKK